MCCCCFQWIGFEKSYLVDLLWVCLSDRLLVCVDTSFPFGFEAGMWDLIVLVLDHCISFCFEDNKQAHIFRFT